MKYRVHLIEEAENDLSEIYMNVQKCDCVAIAENLLTQIEDVCHSLDQMPQRGHVPYELLRINVTQYLEVHHKPYRVIYEIEGKNVYIHCILDGRRDLIDLLTQRLLR